MAEGGAPVESSRIFGRREVLLDRGLLRHGCVREAGRGTGGSHEDGVGRIHRHRFAVNARQRAQRLALPHYRLVWIVCAR